MLDVGIGSLIGMIVLWAILRMLEQEEIRYKNIRANLQESYRQELNQYLLSSSDSVSGISFPDPVVTPDEQQAGPVCRFCAMPMGEELICTHCGGPVR